MSWSPGVKSLLWTERTAKWWRRSCCATGSTARRGSRSRGCSRSPQKTSTTAIQCPKTKYPSSLPHAQRWKRYFSHFSFFLSLFMSITIFPDSHCSVYDHAAVKVEKRHSFSSKTLSVCLSWSVHTRVWRLNSFDWLLFHFFASSQKIQVETFHRKDPDSTEEGRITFVRPPPGRGAQHLAAGPVRRGLAGVQQLHVGLPLRWLLEVSSLRIIRPRSFEWTYFLPLTCWRFCSYFFPLLLPFSKKKKNLKS